MELSSLDQGHFRAIIIGAGQAGLAAAHELLRRGLTPGEDFLVLDANDGPGGAWRHRWDSLTLGTVPGIADLPGLPMNRPDPPPPPPRRAGDASGPAAPPPRAWRRWADRPPPPAPARHPAGPRPPRNPPPAPPARGITPTGRTSPASRHSGVPSCIRRTTHARRTSLGCAPSSSGAGCRPCSSSWSSRE